MPEIVLQPRLIATTATANAALAAGFHTPVDATSGNRTMTLPTPSNGGASVSVEKIDASSNTVTISGNIRGGASTITLTSQYQTLILEWFGTTWRPTADHRTKTAIDAAIDGKIATQAATDAGAYLALDRSQSFNQAARTQGVTNLGFARYRIVDAATYGGGTVDASTHIQGLSDELEALGGGYLFVPAGTYRYSYIATGNNVIMVGSGIGATVFKMIDGVTHRTPDGSAPTGSYAITCKSGCSTVGYYDFEIDGNYTASTDYPHFDSAWRVSDGAFTPGLYKTAGLCIGQLVDTSWVAPDHVWIDRVYIHDCVRSPFVFAMTDGRADTNPGYVHAGQLHAKNSAIDHLIYASHQDSISIGDFLAEGYARGGMITTSGARIGRVSFKNLVANPNSTVVHSFTYDTLYCIDDRGDVRGSHFGSVNFVGDIAALGGDVTSRCLIHASSYAPTVKSIQIEHTGAGADLDFTIIRLDSSAGAPGTQYGPTIESITGRNLPGQTRLFAHDPNAYGGTLIGGKVSNAMLDYHPSAASWAGALITFNGAKVVNFVARDITVETGDFGAGGPSAVYSNACTNSFNATFENISMARALAANAPWIDATSGATGVQLVRISTTAGALTAALKFTADRIRASTFGSTVIRDSDVIFIEKNADQTITASSTTLHTDSQRQADLWPNATYEIVQRELYDSDTSAGYSFRFDLTALTGAVMDFKAKGPSLSANLSPSGTTTLLPGAGVFTKYTYFTASTGVSSAFDGLTSSGTVRVAEAELTGTVITAAVGGTALCRFTQAVSSSIAGNVKKGSILSLRRVR